MVSLLGLRDGLGEAFRKTRFLAVVHRRSVRPIMAKENDVPDLQLARLGSRRITEGAKGFGSRSRQVGTPAPHPPPSSSRTTICRERRCFSRAWRGHVHDVDRAVSPILR